MYPVSANPRERISKRGGRKRAHARSHGTTYAANPESPGMVLRTRTTSGPKPKPTLFTKYSPQTRPTSNLAVRAVTSRRTARAGLCRYTPASFAKSLPLPIGTTPSATSPPLPWRSTPFATSCTVPSPPTATIRCAPAPTACAASSAPWPGPSVRATSTDHPWWWNSRAIGSSARAAAPRPAAGLSTTWAWIRGFIIRTEARSGSGSGLQTLGGSGSLRARDRILAAGRELDGDGGRRRALGDDRAEFSRIEPGLGRAAGVVVQRLTRRDREGVAACAGRVGRRPGNGPIAAREARADLDRPGLVRGERRQPLAHVGRGRAAREGVLGRHGIGELHLVGRRHRRADTVLDRGARAPGRRVGHAPG